MFKLLATRFEYCFTSSRQALFFCLTSSRQALFSLEFIVLFLFKVYIKQGQIWRTLPASEMELFGTIVIVNRRRI